MSTPKIAHNDPSATDPTLGRDQHDPAAQPSLQGQETPIVICAWCGTVIRPGSLSLPTSHGICMPCRAKVLEQQANYEAAVDAAAQDEEDACEFCGALPEEPHDTDCPYIDDDPFDDGPDEEWNAMMDAYDLERGA